MRRNDNPTNVMLSPDNAAILDRVAAFVNANLPAAKLLRFRPRAPAYHCS